MGDTHHQPAADGHAKENKALMKFSGMANMFRIMLMYYVNGYTFFEEPEKDWRAIIEGMEKVPTQAMFFD